jgi:hypothetical protein
MSFFLSQSDSLQPRRPRQLARVRRHRQILLLAVPHLQLRTIGVGALNRMRYFGADGVAGAVIENGLDEGSEINVIQVQSRRKHGNSGNSDVAEKKQR